MNPLAGRRRTPLAAVALALLSLAGLASPVAAQPGDRSPGVPPPVDLAALPTPDSVNAMPYTVNNPATQQTGPVQRWATCQQQVTGSLRDLDDEPAAQQRLRIREAQRSATGRGQLVAVIDSGVQPHPRLSGGRLIDGGDYIEGRGGLFDCDGHGTAVAGLIAAAPDRATGFVGVAPGAGILSIRQASTFYSVPLRQLKDGQEIHPSAGDTVSMARAVVRAVGRGATVINISEAACFPAESNQVKASDLQAAVRYAVDHNVVVVVAAANVSDTCKQNSPGVVTTISSPGWFDEDVLTVAATDEDGAPADFSMHGPWVDVAAPGTGAVSLADGQPGLTGGLVDAHGVAHALDGTSFATPYVAGLVALVRERFTTLSARQVMHRIKQTARHPADPGGRNDEIGYGLIDPVAALTTALPEEHSTQAQPTQTEPAHNQLLSPARLVAPRSLPPEDTLPRTVALAGSAAALGLLGVTLLVVQIVKRQRQPQ